MELNKILVIGSEGTIGSEIDFGIKLGHKDLDVTVTGIYNLAVETNLKKIPLIIISTGAVFNGGLNDSFSEDNIPEPLNVYGKTKYIAEILVQKINDNNLIIRTGWLFGFIKKQNFFDKIMNLAEKNLKIEATNDQYGSPTYVKDFIDSLKNAII